MGFKEDEVVIAEQALNSADWDPNVAFVAAKNLTIAVQQTRKMIRNRGVAQFFPADGVLAALTASEQKPQAAAALLLGMPSPDDHEGSQPGAPIQQKWAQRERPAGYAQPQRVERRGQVHNHAEND